MITTNTYCVYMPTFPNNKVYIGITGKDPNIRWSSGGGYKHQMKSAIQKYGWDNIQHEILYQNLSRNEATRLEIELIKQYNSTDHQYGYNISKGGNIPWNAGKPITPELRAKMSAVRKGRVAPNKGIPATDEFKHKVSEAKMGSIPWNKGLKTGSPKVPRKPLTDEQRQRISEATKAGIRNKRSSLIS